MNASILFRVVVAILSLSGCSLTPVGQPTSSAPPQVSAAATATATSRPTAGSPTRPPDQTQAPPPRGFLKSATETIEGWPGSYCWQGTCADAAGIPAKADLPQLEAANGQLEFGLSDGATFTKWVAMHGDGSKGPLATLAEGGESFDPDASPATDTPELTSAAFAPPESGDWLVLVSVSFPGGDLSYAWHVVVP